MKTVIVDYRISITGIGTYTTNLLKYIAKASRYKISVLTETGMADLPENSINAVNFISPIYTVKEQLEYIKAIPKCDLFWSPHFNVPVFKTKALKTLVTIHDINHLQNWIRKSSVKDFVKSHIAEILIKIAIKKSEHVITVSNFTKNELLKKYKFPENKITVIYSGVDHLLFHTHYSKKIIEEIKEKYSLKGDYLIYIGSIKTHKNIVRLIQAFNIVSMNHSIKLVIVGKKDRFLKRHKQLDKVFAALHRDIQDRVVFTGFIPEAELPVILCGAKMMVFPTLYEGFGLPPLEAMACGCPTVVSNVTSVPEICENASIYCDPYSIDSIAKSIMQLLSDDTLRNNVITAGLQHVKKFDWKKSADKHLEIIDMLLNT